MKIFKKNTFNLFLIAITVSSFLFVSCNSKDTSKQASNKEIAEEVTDLELEEPKNKLDLKKEFITRTYKMKDGTALVYNLDRRGISGFDDWKDYTVINSELATIRDMDGVNSKNRLKNLNYRVANLGNTIPNWLKTEEVMEDVADIQKEYLELISDPNASDKEIKENFEEVSEQFDDLKEELEETIQKYTEIYKDAIEEFNEEYEEGNIEEAIEEYNEEIKKMAKLIEK